MKIFARIFALAVTSNGEEMDNNDEESVDVLISKHLLASNLSCRGLNETAKTKKLRFHCCSQLI